LGKLPEAQPLRTAGRTGSPPRLIFPSASRNGLAVARGTPALAGHPDRRDASCDRDVPQGHTAANWLQQPPAQQVARRANRTAQQVCCLKVFSNTPQIVSLLTTALHEVCQDNPSW